MYCCSHMHLEWCVEAYKYIAEHTVILVAGVLNKVLCLLSFWILAEKSTSTVFKRCLLIASIFTQCTIRCMCIHAYTHKLANNMFVGFFFFFMFKSVSTVQPCTIDASHILHWMNRLLSEHQGCQGIMLLRSWRKPNILHSGSTRPRNPVNSLNSKKIQSTCTHRLYWLLGIRYIHNTYVCL